MLYLAWLPFFISPFVWADIFLTVQAVNALFLTTGLFAAAYMWSPAQQPFKDSTHTLSWLFIILCITPLFIHLLLHDLRTPWHAWRFILHITAAWLIFQMCRDKAQTLIEQRAFIYLLAGIAALYVTYALIQAYDIRFLTDKRLFPFWSTSQISRFAGPLMQTNFQGVFLAVTTIAILFHISRKQKVETSLFVFSIISCTGLLLTAGRASFLTFLLGALLFLWLSDHRKRNLWHLFICLLSAICISTIIKQTIPELSEISVLDRFESGSYMARIVIWDICWQLYQQHAILGIGWGNLPAYALDGLISAYQAHPALTEVPMSGGGHAWAHNIILQFAVEGGLFGIFAILLLMSSIGIKITKRNLPSGSVLGGILATMLLAHGMLSVSMMQPFFFILLALFVAALFPREVIKHD